MTRPTQDTLSTYREGLDNIASSADSRIEKNGQFSGPLGCADLARAHDVVKRIQRTDCAVDLATTFKRTSVAS